MILFLILLFIYCRFIFCAVLINVNITEIKLALLGTIVIKVWQKVPFVNCPSNMKTLNVHLKFSKLIFTQEVFINFNIVNFLSFGKYIKFILVNMNFTDFTVYIPTRGLIHTRYRSIRSLKQWTLLNIYLSLKIFFY